MGTQMYISFSDAEHDTDEAFEKRVDNVAREIGDRGKPNAKSTLAPEGVPPAPAPAPAPAPSPVLAPVPEPAPAPAQALAATTTVRPATAETFSPTMLSPAATEGLGDAVSTASFKDLACFLVEMRHDAVMERVDLETKLKAAHVAEIDSLRAEIRQQKAEHRAEMEQLRAELTPAPAQELVSAEQLAALQARLEKLHAAQLLKDEELFALEDLCSDFLELKAAAVGGGMVAQDLVYSDPTKVEVVAKVAKLVVASEGIASDGALARQTRRKFL
jgi:hypothetical protein